MTKESADLLRGILLAHLILFLHLLLIAGLGLVVILFHGVSHYMLWIFLAATLVLLASGFFFYRYIKRGKQTLQDIQESVIFRKRSFEVRLLGGIVSLKFGRPDRPRAIGNAASETHDSRQRLEDPEIMRIRELTGLADMLEKNLITLEEFSLARQKILRHMHSAGQTDSNFV